MAEGSSSLLRLTSIRWSSTPISVEKTFGITHYKYSSYGGSTSDPYHLGSSNGEFYLEPSNLIKCVCLNLTYEPGGVSAISIDALMFAIKIKRNVLAVDLEL